MSHSHSRFPRRSKANIPTSYTFHVYGRSEGLAGVIISDHEYPQLVAHRLLSQIVDEFLQKHPRTQWHQGTPVLEFPELGNYIVKYQDPKQADSIMKIQQELNETKIVLHKTIESVLERGEKLDSLVARSEGLSASSKAFYTQVCGNPDWMVRVLTICEGEEAELVLRHYVSGAGRCAGIMDYFLVTVIFFWRVGREDVDSFIAFCVPNLNHF